MKSKNKLIFVLGTGFLAGVINGLLGAGGGILITYALVAIADDKGKPSNDIFANALATMLPISLVSSAIYFLKGHIELKWNMLYFLIPAVLGGIAGSILLKKLNFKLVKILFTGIVIYSGFSMLLG